MLENNIMTLHFLSKILNTNNINLCPTISLYCLRKSVFAKIRKNPWRCFYIDTHRDFYDFFIFIPVAELPRPICPFWATVYGRNLSGFGGRTGFDFFFHLTKDTQGAFSEIFHFYFSVCLFMRMYNFMYLIYSVPNSR